MPRLPWSTIGQTNQDAYHGFLFMSLLRQRPQHIPEEVFSTKLKSIESFLAWIVRNINRQPLARGFTLLGSPHICKPLSWPPVKRIATGSWVLMG
jgi:hypothetical protein